MTVFLTTHRLEEAERPCDRVAILSMRLRTMGRPEELRERFFSKSLLVRTVGPLRSGRVSQSRGSRLACRRDEGYVLSVRDARIAAPEVARALVAAGADVLSLSEDKHSLEDVYLELVNEDVEASR